MAGPGRQPPISGALHEQRSLVAFYELVCGLRGHVAVRAAAPTTPDRSLTSRLRCTAEQLARPRAMTDSPPARSGSGEPAHSVIARGGARPCAPIVGESVAAAPATLPYALLVAGGPLLSIPLAVLTASPALARILIALGLKQLLEVSSRHHDASITCRCHDCRDEAICDGF
jgi:hypothetical protein